MGHTVVTPCPASPATDHHFRRALLLSLCPLNGDGINYGLRRILGVVVIGDSWGLLPVLRILRRRNGVPLLVWDVEGTLWAERCGAGDGDSGGDVVLDGWRGWRGSHLGRWRTALGYMHRNRALAQKQQTFPFRRLHLKKLLRPSVGSCNHTSLTPDVITSCCCCPSS